MVGMLAKKDPNGALQACDDIKEEKWRGECFFLVSDNVKLIGDDRAAARSKANL